MRRTVILAAAFAVVAAGLGCKHVAGVCDCYHEPSNAQVNPGGPGSAYPTLGQPIPSTAVPEKMPVPVEKAPAPMGK